MKKILTTMLVVIISLATTHAQNNNSVGIGTLNPDSSAILHLESVTQGFLMTRLNTSQIGNVSTPAEGLIVFNTDDKCYWFHDSTSWKRLCNTDSLLTLINNLGDTIGYIYDSLAVHHTNITNNTTNINNNTTIIQNLSDSLGWVYDSLNVHNTNIYNLFDSINQINIHLGQIDSTLLEKWDLWGNAGTNPTLNFLGTTDAADLVFRTNSTERVRITSGGNLGINTTAPTELLDVNSNSIRLRGGATNNFILTSNATGVGTWQNPANNPLISALGNDWKLIGNTGTNTTTNFLGTIDNVDLVFRTNNTEKIRITTQGQIETRNTGSSIFIGLNSGKVDDLSNNENVFIGENTGAANVGGDKNIGLGNGSLRYNTTGLNNTAIGYRAMYRNVAGSYNTIVGYEAYYNNVNSGYSNSAFGYQTLYSSTSGSQNNAFGYMVLYNNTSGSGNVGMGDVTLFNNTTGGGNTAIGGGSLNANTTGFNNTAVGNGSLKYNSTGAYNTGVGLDVLRNTTTGSYNTGLGYYSNWNTNFTNSTGVGYNAIPTASNSVRIGNNTVTSIGGFANWTNVSDGRFKKNIRENVKGLAFIMKLRPVTYNLDLDKIEEFYNTPDSLRLKEFEQIKEQEVQIGFIAQEVEEAAKSLEFDFHGVEVPHSDNEHYGIRYVEFVAPIVKSIQEQQQQIEQLKKEIEYLKSLVLDTYNKK